MGKTIFLSSHILTELADVCTSVAILEHGRLVVSGPIADIARERAEITPGVEPRAVRIKAIAREDAIRAALAPVPGIQSVSPGAGGAFVVVYAGDDDALASIVRALVLADIRVVGVEPERNELERLFLEVTKGDVA
jgi:ABC-2 type transport system ATP-binding protein